MEKIKLAIIVYLFTFLLISCGGGGGGGGSSDSDTADCTDCGGTSGTIKYSGFDIALNEGDFWTYYWSTSTTSGSQSGSSTSTDSGSYTVTLGEMESVNGFDAFPLIIEGKATSMAPKYTYLAIKDHCIFGSKDGVTFEVVFDAKSSKWQGSGFFTDFTASDVSSSSGRASNAFVNTTAVSLKRSQNQDACTYYPGAGTICSDDESYTISENEYYKPGIGPLGYTYSFYYSDSGGGWTTWRTESRELGLVSTTLQAADGFNPKYPAWVEKTPKYTILKGGFCAAAVGSKIYLMGGNTSSTKVTKVDIYDASNDSWSAGTPMLTARNAHSCVAAGSYIYITGGRNSDNETLTSIHRLNTVSGSWSYFYPSMSSAREQHISLNEGTALFTFGGLGASSVEWVTHDGNNSNSGVGMPIQMNHMGGVGFGSSPNWKGYLIGRIKYDSWANSCNNAAYYKTCYSYNPYDNDSPNWSACASMPTARSNVAAVVLDSKIYAIGGRNCAGDTNKVEVYTPASNTWRTVSPMLYKTSVRAAVVNGKIYAFYVKDGKIKVEEYDPGRE